jgi:hypothetical protein
MDWYAEARMLPNIVSRESARNKGRQDKPERNFIGGHFMAAYFFVL